MKRLAGPKPEFEYIVFSDSCYEKRFFVFRAVYIALGSKLAESANMTPKLFYSQPLVWVSKNAEFDADLKSVQKGVQIPYHGTKKNTYLFTLQYCVQKFSAL